METKEPSGHDEGTQYLSFECKDLKLMFRGVTNFIIANWK
jgi:hypothetical protein